MARFFSGNSGKVKVGSATLKVTDWNADPQGDLNENTHSGSGGYKGYNPGNQGLTGTVSMQWDAEDNPTDSPPNLNPLAEVALELYLEDAAGFYLDVPSAYITGTPIGVPNGGNVTFQFNFTANGPWTMPSGNF